MKLGFIIFFILVTTPVFAAKSKVVLFPLQTGSCSREVVNSAEQLLRKELQRYNYNVLSKKIITRYYKVTQIRNCNGKACARQSVYKLNAHIGLFGSISKKNGYAFSDNTFEIDLYIVLLYPWKNEKDFYRITQDEGRYIFQIKNNVQKSLKEKYSKKSFNRFAFYNVHFGLSSMIVSPEFKNVHSSGLGIELQTDMIEVHIFNAMYFGADIGLYYFNGSNDNIKQTLFLPATCNMNLRFYIFNAVILNPEIGIGSLITILKRNVNKYINEAYSYKQLLYSNPMAKVALGLQYEAYHGFNFYVKAGYGIVFDKHAYGQYATLSFGSMILL